MSSFLDRHRASVNHETSYIYFRKILPTASGVVNKFSRDEGVKFSDDEDLIFFLTLQFQKENEILIVRELDCLI